MQLINLKSKGGQTATVYFKNVFLRIIFRDMSVIYLVKRKNYWT